MMEVLLDKDIFSQRVGRCFWEHWVLISDPMFIGTIQAFYNRVCDCVVGFIYIDHEYGLTLKIEHLCAEVDELLDPLNHQYEDAHIIIRLAYIPRFNPILLSARQTQSLGLPEHPAWLHFYQNEDLARLRRLQALDPIRASAYPDDIQILLSGSSEYLSEVVWVRMEQCIGTDGIVCSLLEQPYRTPELMQGDRIIVQLVRDQGRGDSIIALQLALTQCKERSML